MMDGFESIVDIEGDQNNSRAAEASRAEKAKVFDADEDATDAPQFVAGDKTDERKRAATRTRKKMKKAIGSSSLDARDAIHKHMRVQAEWKNGSWYSGMCVKVSAGEEDLEYDVLFDDNDIRTNLTWKQVIPEVVPGLPCEWTLFRNEAECNSGQEPLSTEIQGLLLRAPLLQEYIGGNAKVNASGGKAAVDRILKSLNTAEGQDKLRAWVRVSANPGGIFREIKEGASQDREQQPTGV